VLPDVAATISTPPRELEGTARFTVDPRLLARTLGSPGDELVRYAETRLRDWRDIAGLFDEMNRKLPFIVRGSDWPQLVQLEISKAETFLSEVKSFRDAIGLWNATSSSLRDPAMYPRLRLTLDHQWQIDLNPDRIEEFESSLMVFGRGAAFTGMPIPAGGQEDIHTTRTLLTTASVQTPSVAATSQAGATNNSGDPPPFRNASIGQALTRSVSSATKAINLSILLREEWGRIHNKDLLSAILWPGADRDAYVTALSRIGTYAKQEAIDSIKEKTLGFVVGEKLAGALSLTVEIGKQFGDVLARVYESITPPPIFAVSGTTQFLTRNMLPDYEFGFLEIRNTYTGFDYATQMQYSIKGLPRGVTVAPDTTAGLSGFLAAGERATVKLVARYSNSIPAHGDRTTVIVEAFTTRDGRVINRKSVSRSLEVVHYALSGRASMSNFTDLIDSDQPHERMGDGVLQNSGERTWLNYQIDLSSAPLIRLTVLPFGSVHAGFSEKIRYTLASGNPGTITQDTVQVLKIVNTDTAEINEVRVVVRPGPRPAPGDNFFARQSGGSTPSEQWYTVGSQEMNIQFYMQPYELSDSFEVIGDMGGGRFEYFVNERNISTSTKSEDVPLRNQDVKSKPFRKPSGVTRILVRVTPNNDDTTKWWYLARTDGRPFWE